MRVRKGEGDKGKSPSRKMDFKIPVLHQTVLEEMELQARSVVMLVLRSVGISSSR